MTPLCPETSAQSMLTKNERQNISEMLTSLKRMQPTAQLELWMKVIDDNTFSLQQLNRLRNAIDDRIKVDIISKVPHEIALYIVSFLKPKDLCQAAQTCRSWRTICEDSRLWREFCIEDGLLDDDQSFEMLFQKRIARSHSNQEKFVLKCISRIPEQQWRKAYMKHINIVRNWKSREFRFDENSAEPKQTSSPLTSLPQYQLNPFEGDQIPAFEGRNLMKIRCHEDSVITCLQYNYRTNTIVSGSDDHTLCVWSALTGRFISCLKGHTGGVWSSQLSPDDVVISGSTDRTVRVWNAHAGKLLHILYGHTSTVRCLALNGDLVVSGSRDTTLRLWNFKNGLCLNIFTGHQQAVRCVEFRNDTIVSGAYDYTVKVWDAKTGYLRHHLDEHQSRIYSLQFDGRLIASGSLDCNICVWDAKTGILRHKLCGHASLTSKMQLRGETLVSANADSLAKIWDLNTGQCLHTLGSDERYKHKSAITSVFFDSKHVVTSSDDGSVKLWNKRTGEFIRDLVVLPTASNGGVVWRFKATYTKLICAVGSRTETEDTHLLILNFN